MLREAWERAVADLLFNQAVMRYNHRIKTQRLKKVHDIREADLTTIDTGMGICSTWLPGHSQAMAINAPLPTPEDFSMQVQWLQDFCDAMCNRSRN
jgi:hypothetical protein